MMRLACSALAVFAWILAQSSPARAQDAPGRQSSGVVTVNWEMALPVGSFTDVQEDVSLRGLAVDARYFVHPLFSVGGSISIQNFHDDFPARTIERPNGAVTAKLDEYTLTWLFRGIAHYYPLGREQIAPYLGVGVGYGWANRLTLVTDFSVQDTAGGFALSPELGLLANLSKEIPAGLMASVRYNFTTASPDRVDSLSFLSWTAGAFFAF